METQQSQEKGRINPISKVNKQGTERKPFPGNKYQYKYRKIYLTPPSWLKLSFHFVLQDINLSHSGEWQTRQMATDGAHCLGVLRDSSARASLGLQMEDIKWPGVA